MLDSSSNVFGLLSIGQTQVALPLSILREVVPCPSEFTPLPVKIDGLIGAMELRGSIVPVVDIRPAIGADNQAGENQVVVVMTDGEYIVGLLADQLHSVQQIEADNLVRVDVREGHLLFSDTFLHPDDRSVISILSVSAILDLPGLPLVCDNSTNDSITTLDPSLHLEDSDAPRYTMVRCGAFLLAFNINTIHTTIPDCSAQASVLSSELCFGVTAYSGHDVPVIDPLALLGLGKLVDSNGPGIVMKLDSGFVVFALSELIDLAQVSDNRLSAVPAFSVQRPQLFRGVHQNGSDLFLIVDGNALLADAEVRAHAAMNTDSKVEAGLADSRGSVVDHGRALLRFSIGLDAAVPLSQINEILPMPEKLSPSYADPYVLGMMAHREGVVPVVCLRTLLGKEVADPTSQTCLLLVGDRAAPVALMVDSLAAIDDQAWIDPDAPESEDASLLGFNTFLSTSPLVQVTGDSALIPKLDLSLLVSLLRNPTLEEMEPLLARETVAGEFALLSSPPHPS